MLLKVLVSMMSAPASRYCAVDLGDDVGPRQHEQVVVAAQIARMRREALAAEIGLGQLVALDHRPHRAVEHEDALREQRVELCRTSGVIDARSILRASVSSLASARLCVPPQSAP